MSSSRVNFLNRLASRVAAITIAAAPLGVFSCVAEKLFEKESHYGSNYATGSRRFYCRRCGIIVMHEGGPT